MCRYEKRVVYFDVLEGGEKTGTAGFAKLVVQNGQLRLSVNISGLHNAIPIGANLFLNQEEIEVLLDSLLIKDGRCVYSRLFQREELQKIGAVWEEAYGVCVKVEDGRVLKACWREQAGKQTLQEEFELQKVEQITSQVEFVEETIMQTLENNDRSREVEQESLELESKEQNQKNESHPLMAEKVLDDKWQQLWQVFPHIHPFGDAKEYLSVTPKDYIVLTKEYQKLSNNSFLLHGFYNYHHTILGKIQNAESGQEQYYLGVPGVYYEREKAVALMFGFESFECAIEPAQTGTFGYYMKRVEI